MLALVLRRSYGMITVARDGKMLVNAVPIAPAGVSRVTRLPHAAQCNKAPFMYEMKGALSGYGPGSAGFPALRLRVGQSPGLTVPDRLVAQPHQSRSAGRPASLSRFARSPGLPGATRRPPVPSTAAIPVSRPFPRPGEAPGWCSFPAVKVFLRPPRPSRKSLREFIVSFFRVNMFSTELHRLSAYRSSFPPPYAQLIPR